MALMGTRLNSWEDLLDNYGKGADALKAAFVKRLMYRDIPNVEFGDGTLSIPLGESRPYHFSKHKKGACISVAIREYGKDLFIAWTLWWKPQIKWNVIFGVLGVCAVFGLISAFQVGHYAGFITRIAAFFGALISTSIFIFICVALAGIFLRGSGLAFFMTELDIFTIEDMTAQTFAIDHSLRKAADAIGIKIKLRERNEFYCGKKSGTRLF